MEVAFAYTILYVADVPKSIRFYCQAFGFSQKLLTPENDYGEINSGGTTLAFASHELGRSNFSKGFQPSDQQKQPFGIELVFATSAVAATMEKAIANGAQLLEPAVQKPWGQEVGYLRDPDGFILEICTPIQSQ